MEQKKILWVILSVSLFVLVIFGVASLFYSPSRNTAITQAGGETIPFESSAYGNAGVDPDMWARDPDRVASLDRNAPPAAGNIINLHNNNIISMEGQGNASSSDIDVSDLTAQSQTEEPAGLPKELAEQVGITAEKTEEEKPPVKEEPVQKPAPAVAKPQKTVEKKPVQVAKAPAKKSPVQSAAPAKAKPLPKAKVSAPKPEMQTLYWVQIASLASRINAERARDTLAAQHMKVEIFTKETSSGLTHRVRVGPFTNNTEAAYWLKNIQTIDGFERSYISEERVKG